MKNVLYLLTLLMVSCEFTINPELAEPEELMVVDAFLNDLPGRQEINITRSQPYFESIEPELITGLTVTLEDLSDDVSYAFTQGTDSYYLDVSEPIAVVGHDYRLVVETPEETFEATASMKRVQTFAKWLVCALVLSALEVLAVGHAGSDRGKTWVRKTLKKISLL